MRHLYVHIPFCRTRCAYCDFTSEPLKPRTHAERVERYLTALRRELSARTEMRARGRGLDTIYMGGGTPTVLPAQMLLELSDDLASRLEPGGEFTVEANPGTIDATLLRALTAAGVTRLSVGVQSFSASALATLGRRVTQEEIAGALEAVADAGWGDWNLDLVFGVPGQTWPQVAFDIDEAVNAGPTHISLYDLTYTESYERQVGARMGAGARRAAGAFAEQHYGLAVARLEKAGYRRYEISNFARPGFECRHNQAYWRGEDYVGIGASAVSTLGEQRLTNPRGVDDYLAGQPPHVETLSATVRLWERAMLGLRTVEGVEEHAVLSVLDVEVRDRLLAQGCLERRYGKLRLNRGFLNVSNSVIGTLLVAPGGP